MLPPPAALPPADGLAVEPLPAEDPLPLPVVPIVDPALPDIRALVSMNVPREDPLAAWPLDPADEDEDEEPPPWSRACTHPTSVTVCDEAPDPLRAPDWLPVGPDCPPPLVLVPP